MGGYESGMRASIAPQIRVDGSLQGHLVPLPLQWVPGVNSGGVASLSLPRQTSQWLRIFFDHGLNMFLKCLKGSGRDK